MLIYGNYSNHIRFNKFIKLVISFIMPILIVIFKPLSMNLNQSIILATLILVLTWWTTEIINRLYSSIFLLIAFSIFGGSELREVFKFPLSSNFYLIIFAFLLSQGIVNSNIANRLGNLILGKYGNSYFRLVAIAFILGILLIFLIPQSFSRVILIFSIYEQFFKNKKIPLVSKEVMMFCVSVATTSTIMFFTDGDIILNYAAMEFGNIDLSWIEWAKYMFLPTLFTSILTGLFFILVFKKELKEINIEVKDEDLEKKKLDKNEKITIMIMSVVILFWMTGQIHSINATIVALVGVVAMFIFKIIGFKDYKSVDINLMIFLTAAYSIGAVMQKSGVASIIYSRITAFFPTEFSSKYILLLITSVMIIHMLLGSALTTLIIVIPGLLEVSNGIINEVPLVLMIYIVTNIHYMLPFHQMTVMIGSGKNYFPNNIVIKFGFVLTLLVFIVIFGFYIPWWKFIGLL